jgi:hypothetical protein
LFNVKKNPLNFQNFLDVFKKHLNLSKFAWTLLRILITSLVSSNSFHIPVVQT